MAYIIKYYSSQHLIIGTAIYCTYFNYFYDGQARAALSARSRHGHRRRQAGNRKEIKIETAVHQDAQIAW